MAAGLVLQEPDANACRLILSIYRQLTSRG
jgi:hypothetical protein